MSNRPIDVLNPWAKYIFQQWKQIPTPKGCIAELYKCSTCFGREVMYKWNLGMCPEELCGLLNCYPEHKNGIQVYLAADATPDQGGIFFATKTAFDQLFYYQPNFMELGIEINRAKPTEFEMINLLIALFVFKHEILSHRTVRIIIDNNYLRARGKHQRHALTEAIAVILEWCENFGCEINELFLDNKLADEPFLKVADRLSRNKPIMHNAKEIPTSKKNLINSGVVAAINKILRECWTLVYIAESRSPYKCRRLWQMMSSYFPFSDFYALSHYDYDVPHIEYAMPKESNWFWTKLIFGLLGIFICFRIISEN